MIRPCLCLTAVIAALAGCTAEPTDPAASTGTSGAAAPAFTVKNGSQLHFLTPAPDAPPLAETSVTFYAVRGQDREAFIWYHKHAGDPDSSKLARFKVPKESLVRRPNGTPIAVGDSIKITMSVPDITRLQVEFKPAGLRFAAGRPGKLTLWYLEADHDFNDDGNINSTDAALETKFRIWRQEQVGAPFTSQLTERNTRTEQLESDVPGFTRYVIAY
jgi:hypothetical protein